MNCPICKRKLEPGQRDRPGSYFPFCSERCKLIDLGRWLGERYQVPVVDPDDADGPAPPTDWRPDD